MANWHRLFGLVVDDYFSESPLDVELEKDLSQSRQLLDVVILRKEAGTFPGSLPDGLENLSNYNLLSYKSLHEPLDAWAIDELLGHMVNYRKQVSRPLGRLLPQEQFRIYGISTRFPQKLMKQVKLEYRQPGVYEALWGMHRVQILVLSRMPDKPQNAVWEMFSAVPELVASGAEHYRPHNKNISTVITELFDYYHVRGIYMRQTIEEFKEEIIDRQLRSMAPNVLRRLTPEDVLRYLPSEELLKGLPAEERVKGLPAEERVKGLSVEDRLQGLTAEELINAIPLDELESLIRRRKRQK